MHRALIMFALLPALTVAAENGPVADYPSFVRVDNVLAAPPRVGSKVSVFGLPRCLGVDDCILISDQGNEQRASIRVDRSRLDGSDSLRLFHCYDPGGEQCIAVIYGIASRNGLLARRIWWRSIGN